MRIETLEAYNVPADIIDVWRSHVGAELLPVQERAVKEFGLFGADNLIVFSPTSSGKTFIGEMAAVKPARENTKVFYLVPHKALAEEKYREFSRRYAKAGVDVVISSRDRRELFRHGYAGGRTRSGRGGQDPRRAAETPHRRRSARPRGRGAGPS